MRMLSENARSILRSIRREIFALWVLALAFLAGLLNAAGFIEFGQTLSHMTGNLTKLGLAMAGDVKEPALLFAMMLFGFFAGAALSGLGFPEHRPSQWRRCGLVLLAAGGMLFVMEWLLTAPALRMAVLAIVLGAQNGLAMRYQGALTRTTHMTGHLTDCSAALGRMIRQKSWKGKNLKLFLFHLGCLVFFLLGVLFTGLFAPALKQRLSLTAVSLAGLAYLLLGAGTLLRGSYEKKTSTDLR